MSLLPDKWTLFAPIASQVAGGFQANVGEARCKEDARYSEGCRYWSGSWVSWGRWHLLRSRRALPRIYNVGWNAQRCHDRIAGFHRGHAQLFPRQMPWVGCLHGSVGVGHSFPGEGRVDELGCSLRGANRSCDRRYSGSSDPVALPQSQLTSRCSRRTAPASLIIDRTLPLAAIFAVNYPTSPLTIRSRRPAAEAGWSKKP